MRRFFVSSAPAVFAVFCGCASEPPPTEALQPRALRAAQERGVTELGCPVATAEVLSKETIQEPQGTGWYEPPHRAEYTVAISGCGQHATYAVNWDDRHKDCAAGPVSVSAAPPQPLADQMQPDAVRAAQQRGSADLGCPAATAEVMNAETLQEPQGTGWYEPPHRTRYTIDVSGCGKRTRYSVACDNQKKACQAGPLVSSAAAPAQLSDKMQPKAVEAAQRKAALAVNCPSVSTEVLTAKTIEEPQTTGWYEPPHRAEYTIGVSGCGKRATYAVACDERTRVGCLAATAENGSAE